MTLIDSLKALFSRRESTQTAHAEDIPDPTDRPLREQESYEEMKDDDAVARGTTPVAPTLGPGTPTEVRDEFEADQQTPRDPTP
jgi:hypothetical protein